MFDEKAFVRKVWQGLPREPRIEETGKWKMAPGVTWLRQPEMWCPYCEVSWINKWTWLVDEKKGKVLGVWKEDGSKLHLADVHPHVMSGGEMCLGDGTVMEGLTSGFNISSCFCLRDEFYRVMKNLGHADCRQECEDEDEEDRSYCDLCDEVYDAEYVNWYSQADAHLCEDCWINRSVRCDSCLDRFYYPEDGSQDFPLTEVRGGDEFCSCCLDDYLLCERCEEWVHCEDMRPWSEEGEDVPTCQRCWRDAHEECQECGRLKQKEDVTDGICDRCRERMEAEEAALAEEEQDEQTEN